MADETTTATVTEDVTPEVTPETTETVAAPEPETLDAAALKAQLEGAQAQIAKLNKENEKRRLAEKTAAEQKLADDGKLKELAEQRAAERDAANTERDALAEKVKKANELLLADVKSQIEKWPDEVKKLVVITEDADALELKAKVLDLQPLAEKLMNASPKPGNGTGPTPQGGAGVMDEKERGKSVMAQIKSVF